MFNQCSFFFKSSSFKLAILIGFESRLCFDKRVLNHLPVSSIDIPEKSLQGILSIGYIYFVPPCSDT